MGRPGEGRRSEGGRETRRTLYRKNSALALLYIEGTFVT
jgi:hypothetical protein